MFAQKEIYLNICSSRKKMEICSIIQTYIGSYESKSVNTNTARGGKSFPTGSPSTMRAACLPVKIFLCSREIEIMYLPFTEIYA